MSKKIQPSSQKSTKISKKSQNIRVLKQNKAQNETHAAKSSQKSTPKPKTETRNPKLKPKTETANGELLLNKPQPDIATLTREWYKALKDSGFKDLEAHDSQMRPMSMLNGQSLSALASKAHWHKTFHFYARLRTFLTFNPNWHKSPATRLICELYTEGTPYRDIVKELKAKRYRKGTNIWNISHVVRDFVLKATHWNKVSSNGLDFESDVGP